MKIKWTFITVSLLFLSRVVIAKNSQEILEHLHSAILSETVLPPFEGVFGQFSGFGSTIAVDGNLALVGGGGQYPNSTAYLFELEGKEWVEVTRLEPEDTSSLGSYGYGVELEGEWAFVSADRAVYVFRQVNNEWQEFQLLTPNIDNPLFNPETFGKSMSLDNNLILIGDSGTPAPTDGTIGVVFAFEFDGNSWAQIQAFYPEGETNENDNFGFSVSLDNGHAVIGSSYDGNVHFYQFTNNQFQLLNKFSNASWSFGRNVQLVGNKALVTDSLADQVHVYSYDGINWSLETSLTADDSELVEEFGVNAYMFSNKLLVIDPWQSINESTSPAIYEFTESNGIWAQSQKLHQTGVFGSDMAVLGNELLISSHNSSFYGIGSGFISQFKSDQGSWSYHDYVIPTLGAPGQLYGHRTEINDDWIAVSAPEEYSLGIRSGAVFVYERIKNEWQIKQMLTPSDPNNNAYFGRSISLQDDILVVGAIRQNGVEDETGAAYVFQFDGQNWVETQKITDPNGETDDLFGYQVEITEQQILISSLRSNSFGTNFGAVIVYEKPTDSWEETHRFSAADSANGDLFGYSIAVNGDLALIGAPFHDEVNSNLGAVYYFRLENQIWVEQQKLLLSNPINSLEFGREIDIDGNQALIAASPNAGNMAFVFHFENNQWSEFQSIEPPNSTPIALFGQNISIASNHVLINERDYENRVHWFQFDGLEWVYNQPLFAPQDTESRSVNIHNNQFYIGASNNLLGADSGTINIYDLIGDIIFEDDFE
ncbi:FG-GAP repeat protein [Marinicella meishanensis]|uniref:FG-GAP repeat protein n=1 Tax=Marinicella meishanensis TaxID=2873263 RepID=UPI001CBDEBBE|nr:FG-GAP repeat protein [Marinicella sp. NBU2979]